MSYKSKDLLRNNAGEPIPQSWSDSIGDFVPTKIDDRLADIERTQQQILDKLNGTINTDFSGNVNIENAHIDNTPENPLYTRLTGSIEEIYRQTSAEELQPSETWRVLDNEVNRYKDISVFLRRVPSNADVRLRFITRIERGGKFVNRVEADTVESGNYVSVFQDKGVGIVYLIELVNVSSVPITVSDIVIMGRLT